MTAVRTSKSVVSEQERAAALAEATFDLLRSRWALRVLGALVDGPVRFNRLQRDLEPIRHKVLTAALRELERRRLVVRHDHGSVLPHVEYSLSGAGRDLITTVHGLCDWSRAHLDSLLDDGAALP